MRCLLVCLLAATSLVAAEPTNVVEEGKQPADARLTTVRSLNDRDFFLRPPATLAAWQARQKAIREQVLVANGLWPMPARPAIKATIHGRIDREGYSVEKVYFASMPGHYVTGSLYRPRTKDGKMPEGKLPGVLCPHGHWANGRFYDAGDAGAREQVKIKAEKTLEGAHYPLQARCAQLSRMGCVVFHYDMVGYADSKTVKHDPLGGFDAEMRLQSLMGLQTLNSVRSLDFLTALPEVDSKRIGVTGASGGGTQTFILGAIDDRPAVAFPAVMVSTQMQGGCVCENCSFLRVGMGNVDLAAAFAPRPLAMSGADDWTIDIERKGLPELKAVYKLFGAADKVDAKCWPQFKHNYNQVAREMMYEWFNKHLDLKQPSPVVEQPFKPIPPADLTVFDTAHPLPADSVSADRLRKTMTAASDAQIDALRPTEANKLAEYRRVFSTALRVMAGTSLPTQAAVDDRTKVTLSIPGTTAVGGLMGRRGKGELVPYIYLRGKKFNGNVIVWIDATGKSSVAPGGKMNDDARAILASGAAILAVDALGTGELAFEKAPGVNPRYAGYTFGYNRPLLSQRIHDVLTAVAFASKQEGVKKVHLLGRGKAGPWVILARGLCGDAVARTAADVNRFRFEDVKAATDEMALPGALKYGGLGALAALAAPGEIYLHNHRGAGIGQWLKEVYAAADAKEKVKTNGDLVAGKDVVAWLLR